MILIRYTFLFETRVRCTRLCKYAWSLDYWTPACSGWHDSLWCSSACRRKAPLAANTLKLYALPSITLHYTLLSCNCPNYLPLPFAGHRQQNLPPRPPPWHPSHRSRWQVRHPARCRHPRRPRAPASLFLFFFFLLLNHRHQRKDSQLRLRPPRPLRLRLPTLHAASALSLLRPPSTSFLLLVFHSDSDQCPHPYWDPTRWPTDTHLFPAADRRLRLHRPAHPCQCSHDRESRQYRRALHRGQHGRDQR